MPEPLGVRRSRAAGAVVLGADARLQLEDASTRAFRLPSNRNSSNPASSKKPKIGLRPRRIGSAAAEW
jgi:hypothetical protein